MIANLGALSVPSVTLPNSAGANCRVRRGGTWAQLAWRCYLPASNARTPFSGAPSSVSSSSLLLCQVFASSKGLCAHFLRTIFTLAHGSKELAISRGKAGPEVLPVVGAHGLQSGLVLVACLSANQATHTAVVPANNIVQMEPIQRSDRRLVKHFSVQPKAKLQLVTAS